MATLPSFRDVLAFLQRTSTVTAFDDARRRLGDPAALARMKARLAGARQEGRRVWLVMERDDVIDVPEVDVLPVDALPTGGIARIRSNQLRRYLVALYGPARTDALPPDARQGLEIMTAILFVPGPGPRGAR